MNYSTLGYKDNSPDNQRDHNIIQGRNITMQGVSIPLTLIPIVNGKPQYDKKKVAQPGEPDIEFEDDVEGVLEIPYGQVGINPNPYVQNFLNNNPYGTPPMVNVQPPAYQPPKGYADGSVAPANPTASLYDPSLYNTQTNSNIQANSADVTTDPNTLQKVQASLIKQEQDKKKKPFLGAINPYGSWNLENSATALGAFIQDKNLLGTIGSAGKLLLNGARNVSGGAAAMKRYREDLNAYYDNEEDLQRASNSKNWHWMQKGGVMGKILTGNYIKGDDNHSNPSAEVEKGEYLQTPDGKTSEIIGKKHSEGGELIDAPDGSRVISDYLKIGGKLATYFKKEFDLNVKASNSFATVLDKYKKKIGLTDLLEDESKLMDKIVKQEDTEFEGTREINLQVLSEKVNELKPEKQELENKFEVFTNLVFDKQEESKQPEGYNFKKQEGGEVQDPNQQEQGGSEIEQIIVAFAQMTGQDPAQIIQQLQQLPEEEIQAAIEQMAQALQQGQGQEQPVPQEGEQLVMQVGGNIQYAQKGITLSDWEDYFGKYSFEPPYTYEQRVENAKQIIPFLDRFGVKYDPQDLTTKEGLDKLAGLAQNAARSQYKNLTNHYSSLVAPTQTGLQIALDNKLITETQLKSLGAKVNNGKILKGSKNIVPKGNEYKVRDIIVENGKKNQEGYNKYVDTNFVDNRWYFRNPDVQTVEFDTQDQLNEYVKKFKTSFDDNGKKIYYSDKEGLYFTPVVKDTNVIPKGETSNNPDPKQGIDPYKNKDRNWEDGMPMLLPDQSNLPPTLLQPGIRQIGHVQANAIRVSPEETIKELNRQYNTAADLITETNPYTAGAMMSNLQAQTNNSINQAYSQAAITNAQDERNVENINEERIRQRDAYNISKIDNYEQLAQTALQNYTDEWRSYIDKRNLENVNNYNTEMQRQAFNATNDNFKIGSMGWYQTSETPQFKVVNIGGEPYTYNTKTKEYQKIQTTKPDGSKVTTGSEVVKEKEKKGGLLLSDNIKKWLK